MSDIVSRLRERHSFLCDEAAEEIERLHGIIADNSLLNRTDNERLRGLLGEAADDIEHWGGYASEYFKDKWHLEDDIKKYRDAALAGAAVQPSASLLDEAHVLICQAVAAGNMGNDTPIQTRYAMRKWLVKFADVAADPTTAAPSTNSPEISSGLVIADSASAVQK